jgi:hypothetical protein
MLAHARRRSRRQQARLTQLCYVLAMILVPAAIVSGAAWFFWSLGQVSSIERPQNSPKVWDDAFSKASTARVVNDNQPSIVLTNSH